MILRTSSGPAVRAGSCGLGSVTKSLSGPAMQNQLAKSSTLTPTDIAKSGSDSVSSSPRDFTWTPAQGIHFARPKGAIGPISPGKPLAARVLDGTQASTTHVVPTRSVGVERATSAWSNRPCISHDHATHRSFATAAGHSHFTAGNAYGVLEDRPGSVSGQTTVNEEVVDGETTGKPLNDFEKSVYELDRRCHDFVKQLTVLVDMVEDALCSSAIRRRYPEVVKGHSDFSARRRWNFHRNQYLNHADWIRVHQRAFTNAASDAILTMAGKHQVKAASCAGVPTRSLSKRGGPQENGVEYRIIVSQDILGLRPITRRIQAQCGPYYIKTFPFPDHVPGSIEHDGTGSCTGEPATCGAVTTTPCPRGPLTESTFHIRDFPATHVALGDSPPETPYWQYTLYEGPGGEKVKVHYCRSMELSERVAKLFLDKSVLGFDIEWKPQASGADSIKDNVSLIQLACDERIALFHIALFRKDATVDDLVPPTLKKIMESRDITKVGVAVKGDCTRLRKYMGIDSRGLLELSHLHKLVKYSTGNVKKINKSLVSLAKQVEEHLRLPLLKDKVRCSDWTRELNLEQTRYAASDSYAGLQLYYTMDAKRKGLSPTPPRPAHAELELPIVLASGQTVTASSGSTVIESDVLSSAAVDSEDQPPEVEKMAREFLNMAVEDVRHCTTSQVLSEVNACDETLPKTSFEIEAADK